MFKIKLENRMLLLMATLQLTSAPGADPEGFESGGLDPNSGKKGPENGI